VRRFLLRVAACRRNSWPAGRTRGQLRRCRGPSEPPQPERVPQRRGLHCGGIDVRSAPEAAG
jgi:hypothetical protein